ncbi:unnamed protein product, partial [Mesorhabditis belari]|uniref:Uncharacterized protein n=1 Tax=Mesorhabditis belari TaxID=2138241 RepID=A0AAF3FNH2_9BILA
MLNLMVKRAVKRALATTSRPRQGALNGGGNFGSSSTSGLVRKAVGGGILRRVGGRGAFVGAAGLNRVQPQSRVIQRRVAPQHLIVQRSPMVARRFQRIASPDVMNRPMVVRQQTFPARARPQAQTVVVRRIVQAPPQRVQRTIVQRTISRQPQRQQIVERVIPRVRQQQVIRRPVQQQVVRVQRVIQRPQQQIQYVQQRQRGGNRGGVRRLQNRVQMERVNPRFEYENSPRIIVRHRRGFQNY